MMHFNFKPNSEWGLCYVCDKPPKKFPPCFRGTVQGAAARRHAGFAYRNPLLPRMEWPLATPPRSAATTRAEELADYELEIGAADDGGTNKVRVWVMPNGHTEAKDRRLIYEAHGNRWLMASEKWREETLRRAFCAY